jgi:hypothetical protein
MTEDFEIDGRTWVDKTSYARGENPQNKPSNTFATKLNTAASIQIVYGHRNYPASWIFSFAPLDLYQMPLKAQTKEEAAKEAVEHCLEVIEKLKKGFEIEKTKATT